jgi:D-alanyl-lipoteichoic acid acyltransferase DltB (MBOAT superfamily)
MKYPLREALTLVFSSTVFLFLFLPFLLAFYYNPFFKSRGFRNGILLLASLFFYAWGKPLFVFVMMASIAFNWAFSLLVARYSNTRRDTAKRIALASSVVFNRKKQHNQIKSNIKNWRGVVFSV